MNRSHDSKVAVKLAWFTSYVTVLLIAVLAALMWFLGKDYAKDSPLILVVLVVLDAGALGGCLYNLRAITKHTEQMDFYPHFQLTYLLRPLNGAVCGFFVFALFYGGVLTLTVGESSPNLNTKTLVLYIAVALLAGYGSHEFLKKVKDVNGTLFALSDSERQVEKKDDHGPEQ